MPKLWHYLFPPSYVADKMVGENLVLLYSEWFTNLKYFITALGPESWNCVIIPKRDAESDAASYEPHLAWLL